MKRFILVALTACVIALLLTPCTWAKAKKPARKQVKPKVTALICSFRTRGFSTGGDETDSRIAALAGTIAGKGWINGLKARGLLHKGDRLPLYTLESGQIGEILLTSTEHEMGYGVDEGEVDAITFQALARISPSKKVAYDKANKIHSNSEGINIGMSMLAYWNPKGHKPKWITGQIIQRKNQKYRAIVANWLKTKKLSADARNDVVVEQIVQADINGDGRKETFLSFNSGEGIGDFSYLLMCYRPRGTRNIRTVVVDEGSHSEEYQTYICGFCDIDEDGWAEIITYTTGGKSDGDDVRHWVGDRFETFRGWLMGV
jgi:hypothetical protein